MSKWGCPKCGCRSATLLRVIVFLPIDESEHGTPYTKHRDLRFNESYNCNSCNFKFDEPKKWENENDD